MQAALFQRLLGHFPECVDGGHIIINISVTVHLLGLIESIPVFQPPDVARASFFVASWDSPGDSVRSIPSGVTSKIQEKITAMGNPMASRTMTRVGVQPGRFRDSVTLFTSSMITKAAVA